MTKKYQDYVIKDGNFIGDFESMYKSFEDPWLQSTDDNFFDTRRTILKSWVKRINENSNTILNACEIGCGFGFITSSLVNEGLNCYGIDISETAISKAKTLHRNCDYYVSDFLNFDLFESKVTKIFMMTEITWYVLPKLDEFIKKLKNYREKFSEPIYLIHLLATYPPGTQKYGSEYFTDLEGILRYFNLDYIESGIVFHGRDFLNGGGTYFVAKI